ncbi:MAG: hypothetical protein AAFX06_19365 [Planctomycetota bacterium]
MSKGNRGLRLSEVDETVQTEADITSWQAGLRAAMYDAITEEDVSSIVKRQVEKAKEGDAKAIEFVFGQVLGTKRAVTINQTTNQVVTDVETAARIARGE